MKKNYWKIFVATLMLNTLSLSAQEYSSGDADIDKVRIEVQEHKTSEENYRERVLMLYMWMGALQQQGADTHSFFDLDTMYYQLEPRVNNLSGSEYQEALKQMCHTIDEGYLQMKLIQKELRKKGPMFTPF